MFVSGLSTLKKRFVKGKNTNAAIVGKMHSAGNQLGDFASVR